MTKWEFVKEKSKIVKWRVTNFTLTRSHAFRPVPLPPGVSRSLDLGCGARIRNPFGATEVFGVDIVEQGSSAVRTADLVIDPIPFESHSMDFVTAYDFLEHVPRMIYVDGQRRSPFIDLMNEVHRVLKPGGLFHAETPAIPRKEAFTDPTHVNFITAETHRYFTHPLFRDLVRSYGFTGSFEVVDVYWDIKNYYSLVWRLRAV